MPLAFEPQHTAEPSLRRAQYASPGTDAVPEICVASSRSTTGAGELAELPASPPRPSSPEPLLPQQRTPPSFRRTQTESAPAASSTAHGVTEHATGSGLASTSTSGRASVGPPPSPLSLPTSDVE